MKTELFETEELAGDTASSWVDEQRQILQQCAKTGADVDRMLSRVGRDREDLRYEVNTRHVSTKIKAPNLHEFQRLQNGVPIVSFFSGCGGMDLGMEAAGFEHVALVEHNRLFCETLRHNRPTWKVLGPPDATGDISQREELYETLSKVTGLTPPFQGLFVGGPPCQPFSIAANQRFNKNGKNFKRVGFHHETNGNLLFDMLWLISALKPTAFLIENVEGLFDVDEGQQLQRALRDLSDWGYTVAEPFVLDAAHYRVPQHRRRLFICGNRLNRPFTQPRPSYDLVPSGAALRLSKTAKNHDPRLHKPESLLRYMILRYGQRDRLGRVDRLDPCSPSKTVIAGGTKGGGRSHLHPDIPRTMTARESARLQTFPDDYEFLGPSARQFTQVGNAVPPILAAQLGAAIYESFFAKRGRG